jgi:hypothetical protein
MAGIVIILSYTTVSLAVRYSTALYINPGGRIVTIKATKTIIEVIGRAVMQCHNHIIVGAVFFLAFRAMPWPTTHPIGMNRR